MMDLKTATTKQLVAEYNRLTGKNIKKFSSRAAGEKQVLAATNKPLSAVALLPPKAQKVKGARRVKGAIAAEAAGRPVIDYLVTLTPTKAQSHPNSKSLRRQLIEWMEKRGTPAAISQIEKHFGRSMRGPISKLREKDWLATTAVAE